MDSIYKQNFDRINRINRMFILFRSPEESGKPQSLSANNLDNYATNLFFQLIGLFNQKVQEVRAAVV